jgi:hypothetical protein
MTRFGPVILIVLVPLSLYAQDKRDDKDEKQLVVFVSKEGKLSVSVPSKPLERTNKLKTAGGELEVHMFMIDQKDRAFIVSYTDYPAGSVDPDEKKTLAGVVDGNARAIKGRVASNEPITIGKKDYPGRAISIEFGGAKKQIYRARVYLVDNRLYQVVALGPDEFTKSQAVEAYFKSFAIQE